jgi:hypothetical protein
MSVSEVRLRREMVAAMKARNVAAFRMGERWVWTTDLRYGALPLVDTVAEFERYLDGCEVLEEVSE